MVMIDGGLLNIKIVGEEKHSIKIGINAKGKFSGEVKCYGKTPEEALASTMKISKQLELIIEEKNKEVQK